MLVQKLRLKRGWSQQQLAEASGLSVRTVQRIEAGEPASTETLKSLAAVFEVHFSTLNPTPEQDMSSSTATVSTTEREEREAFRHVRKLRRFYGHLAQYLFVISFLTVLNLVVSPHRLWVLWVIFGWGIGVVWHAAGVFRPSWPFGPEWERRQVEKYLGRPL